MSPRRRARSWNRSAIWRYLLFAILLSLIYWRSPLPSDDGSFVHFEPAAYARESFVIVDPDESHKLNVPSRKAARKYNTFAHRVLDIDSEEFPVSPAKYAWLDSIIDDVKDRVLYDPTLNDPELERAQAEEILRAIDQVLTEHNVLYPPGDFDVNSLRAALAPQHYEKAVLDRILGVHLNARRRDHARAHASEAFYILDCDISSFVYVGVAGALGIDLHLVDLPNHMFVRWPLSDGSHVNWDPNIAASLPDKVHATDYSLGQQIRSNRVYLATMTRREAEGFAHYLLATRFKARDLTAQAMSAFEKARYLYPQSTQIASELAWLYATAPGVDSYWRKRSIDLAQSAVNMEPNCGDFWDSLAAAHAANGDFKRAADESHIAESLAASAQERADFRFRRLAFEKGAMPD